jgi:hypothetical protein
MSKQPAGQGTAPPEIIYLIRHGEKPGDQHEKHRKNGKHAPSSVATDFQGNHDPHGLVPLGWQRSGALTALFNPHHGPLRAGLRVPAALLSPSYGDPAKTAARRAYLTIQGLAERLGQAIATPFEVGHESKLAASLLSSDADVVLICWEHHRLPAIAAALPVAPGTVIPDEWPDDRYDVIWAFTRLPGPPVSYAFSELPQRLLPGDQDTGICG